MLRTLIDTNDDFEPSFCNTMCVRPQSPCDAHSLRPTLYTYVHQTLWSMQRTQRFITLSPPLPFKPYLPFHYIHIRLTPPPPHPTLSLPNTILWFLFKSPNKTFTMSQLNTRSSSIRNNNKPTMMHLVLIKHFHNIVKMRIKA